MYNTCGMYAVRVKMKVDSRVSTTVYSQSTTLLIPRQLHFWHTGAYENYFTKLISPAAIVNRNDEKKIVAVVIYGFF